MVDNYLEEQIVVHKDDIVSADENNQSGEKVDGEHREQMALGIEALEPTEQNTHSGTVLTEEEKELEKSFIAELEKMITSSMQ